MRWDREKFIKNMDNILAVYRNHNMVIPEVLQPFLRLYDDLYDSSFPKIDENMQDLKEVLKSRFGDSNVMRKFGSVHEFVVYDNYINEKSRYENLKVIVSAPAMLLTIDDPTISARYCIVLDITNKWGIESIVLVGMFDKQTRGLFRDICQLNLIRVDDNMLDDFTANCSNDIRLALNVDIPPIAKNVDFDHPDRWEKGRLRALLKWDLPIGISMEKAIELAINKRDTWNRIRDEMTHGLGVW